MKRSSWISEDGKVRFYLSENGAIDILPGPNSGVFKWLEENYPGYAKLKAKDPYSEPPNHIHW